MMPRPCGLKLSYTRRRVISSWITNCSSRGALRPPNSGGWPGSSQPASNIAAWNALAHGGTSADDFARGKVVSAGGRLLVEPRGELGADRLDLGREGELHDASASFAIAATMFGRRYRT